jgi:hypothetical protein
VSIKCFNLDHCKVVIDEEGLSLQAVSVDWQYCNVLSAFIVAVDAAAGFTNIFFYDGASLKVGADEDAAAIRCYFLILCFDPAVSTTSRLVSSLHNQAIAEAPLLRLLMITSPTIFIPRVLNVLVHVPWRLNVRPCFNHVRKEGDD